MNKITIGLIAGSIGLIAGSIGSYIFFKKKYEVMYYDKLHEAIDKECETLRNAHHKDFVINDKPSFQIPQVSRTNDENPYQERLNEIEEPLDENSEERTQDDEQGPRFIDEDEFRFLPSKYEIREIQYYRLDGVFLDIDDEPIDNPDIYVSGLQDKLDQMEDYTTAYILVESIGVAVEIVVLERSYNDTFEGVY